MLAKFKVEHDAFISDRLNLVACVPVNCNALLVCVVSFWFGSRLTSLSMCVCVCIEWMCVRCIASSMYVCVCVARARLHAAVRAVALCMDVRSVWVRECVRTCCYAPVWLSRNQWRLVRTRRSPTLHIIYIGTPIQLVRNLYSNLWEMKTKFKLTR